MSTTEARLNQLFNRAQDVLGPAEAETMMEIMRTSMRGDLATASDLHALEQRMDDRFAAMTRTFVTWMLASQAAFTTIVAVFFTVAR